MRPTGNAPKIQIRDIAYFLPETVETNEDLCQQNPTWQMDRVVTRTGVLRRHIAKADETALDLSLRATRLLLDRNPSLIQCLDGVIFCTQTPDYVMPPNACMLHRELELPDSVFALDINLACSGYIYALALAEGLIAAGTCSNMLLVNSDTYSKLINKGDRSARSLFGDGAAASWIVAASEGAGLLDIICETAGSEYEKFYVPAGGHRQPLTLHSQEPATDTSGNVRTVRDIHMDGMGVLSFVNSKVPGQVYRLLARNGLLMKDLDLVIFHQASKLALDSLARTLKLSDERVFRNYAFIGNTVSASIPISLACALQEGRLKGGELVLLSGFGVGLSWASALVRTGATSL